MSRNRTAPPSPLSRAADETYLKEVERRIEMWMMRYVVEHCKPRSPAIRLYVAKHYHEFV
jgi:hypothetical protein